METSGQEYKGTLASLGNTSQYQLASAATDLDWIGFGNA